MNRPGGVIGVVKNLGGVVGLCCHDLGQSHGDLRDSRCAPGDRIGMDLRLLLRRPMLLHRGRSLRLILGLLAAFLILFVGLCRRSVAEGVRSWLDVHSCGRI